MSDGTSSVFLAPTQDSGLKTQNYIHSEAIMSTSRREFLTHTALLVPGISLAASEMRPVKAAPAAAAVELRLGIVTYNIGKSWDIDTLIKNLTECNYEAVELRTTHAHGVEISLPADKRAEVKKRFEASKIKIGGLGTTCEYHSPDPEILKKQIAETKEWVKLAKDVGCPSVKVRPNGLRKDVPEEKSLEQIGKSLKECAAFAQDNGVKIQLEMHGNETSRVPRIKKIFDFAEWHPALWACWNSNQNDLLDGGLEGNFEIMKAKIGQVHMRDLYLEEYPWRKLIQLLQGIKFQGYCFAEISESADPIRTLRYFRGMFRAFQGLV
jgi:sugar phosphate isomerase/epimerase